MNKASTSREELLACSKELVLQGGMQAITIRDVAAAAGISVGAVYHYFDSKDALVIATIGAIWQEIFLERPDQQEAAGFCAAVQHFFERAKQGSDRYPGFFALHAAALADTGKQRGRAAMETYFDGIRSQLLQALEADPAVRPGCFSGVLTRQAFVQFVFSNILTLLIKQEASCAVLLELIRRVLYG